jgi:hypothetical protein
MASGGGRLGGRDDGSRGRVVQGRYSKMRDGRLSVNRWEVLDDEDEQVSGDKGEATVGRNEMTSGESGAREMEVEGTGERNGTPRANNVAREMVVDGVGGNEQERGGEGDVRRKRNLEERSPGAHETQRVSKRRVNEFEMGKLFEEIVKKMSKDIDVLIERAPEVFKRELKEGLKIMVDGMKGIMNGVSDGIASERLAREAEEIRTEDKMEKLMEEVKEIKNVNKGMFNDRMEQRVKASEKEMEDKVKAACCSLKILDMDFGEITEDRTRMVRTVITRMKEDVFPEDRTGYERIIRRTRIVILGKKTVASTSRGRTVYTVPLLLECQNRMDAGDLDVILRRAGYFSAFHWPQEMVSFVEGVREEVRKMGYRESSHYIRVRPEERGGGIQIRADVKEKNGGRFVPKAVWQCPPLNKDYWEFLSGIFEPKIIGVRNVRR